MPGRGCGYCMSPYCEGTCPAAMEAGRAIHDAFFPPRPPTRSVALTEVERRMLLFALGCSAGTLGDHERREPQGWSPQLVLRLQALLS